jgi:hypothetical protein
MSACVKMLFPGGGLQVPEGLLLLVLQISVVPQLNFVPLILMGDLT